MASSSPSQTVVTKIEGDADDVFSHGFICPKGYGLKSPARGPGSASGRH